ncbi:MAG TPA: ABC transporter permease [Bryobacteraceae bacterium]|nr:ABC transporter permease [Bryobacteraceae bacterium]
MDQLFQDLKYGVRTLARSPGFTLVAVLSLALGIGANTAIFTLTDAVFLNPLPVEESSRVLELFTVDHATIATAANFNRTAMSFKNYLDFRDQNDVFSGLAAFVPAGVTLTGKGEPKPEPAMLVTANYFDVLGVKPMLGRTFLPSEDKKPGGNPVVVLSHTLWTRDFGADPGILGQTISLNLTPYTVIGVAPPGFKATFTVGNPNLVWIPMSMHAQTFAAQIETLFQSRRFRIASVFGRLKPGVQPQQALASLKTIASRLEQQYPRDNNGRTVEVSSLQEAALGILPRDQLVIAGVALSSVVGLVLLIACVNLANLLMARSSKRAREMGIRTALGAGRGRIVRQLLTESLLLSAAGGIGGLLIGSLGYQLLWSFRPTFLQQNSLALGMDTRVFVFTVIVALFTGVLFGLAPAVRASTPDLSAMLKTGGRGGTEAWSRSPLRSALVVSEVALALVALVGAGLFIRSMQQVQKTDPGFESKNLFTFDFDVTSRRYSPEQMRQFFRAALDRAQETPGVKSAALSSNPPLGGGVLLTTFAEGQESSPDNRGTLTLINSVSPTFFDTLRIPILTGRLFSDFDRADSARVAVVNEAMQRHFWPRQSAIGKRFRFVNENALRQVVGVVRNTAVLAIGEQPQPVIYLPLEQQSTPFVTLNVRTASAPAAILPAVLARVQSLDNNLVLANPLTIQENLAQGLWAPRMGAALFGIFGLLGMLLASIGIYGVMAYLVAQRTNEIGIRMALGARPSDVLRLVVGHGMKLVLLGIAAGVFSALALTRLMRTLLFDVSPADPLTFVAVSLVLAAVAFVAGWLPALRAARIDPVLALRD